jgi:trigger factor
MVAGTHEIHRLEHSAVKLTIKLTKDEVRSEYEKYLKGALEDLQIPGFRRGKVPVSVFEKKAGPALKEDALNHIISANVQELVKNNSIPDEDMPLENNDPQVDGNPKLDLDGDFEFSVLYDVRPQVKIDKWEGFEVEVDEVEVGEEDVQRKLEEVRDRNAVVMDRDDGAPAQVGDVVTVDFCELDGGKAVGGSEREDFVFTLGSEANHYSFDDEIVGMKKNETRDFEKKFPDDFSDEALAGKTVGLRVALKALKEKKLPHLDDELAQDVDESFKTLDDLKKDIRRRLEDKAAEYMVAMKQNAITMKIIEANPIDLPESMVLAELRIMFRDMIGGGRTKLEDVDRYLEAMPSLVEKWRPQAENGLKGGLIVNELIKSQNIGVTDAEREQELERFAKNTESAVEEVKRFLEENPDADNIDDMVKQKKLFELMESKNTVKLGEKKKYLDIFPEKD